MSDCKCGAKNEYFCICWQEQAASGREQEAIQLLKAMRHELNKALKERDEARECLREAMQAMIGTLANGNKWPERWRKAAEWRNNEHQTIHTQSRHGQP